MYVDPYTLQAKSLPLPLKLGKVLHHKHLSDRNPSIHPRDVKAFMRWLRNKKFAVTNITVAITADTSMNTPLQSLPKSSLAQLTAFDLVITQDWGPVWGPVYC